MESEADRQKDAAEGSRLGDSPAVFVARFYQQQIGNRRATTNAQRLSTRSREPHRWIGEVSYV